MGCTRRTDRADSSRFLRWSDDLVQLIRECGGLRWAGSSPGGSGGDIAITVLLWAVTGVLIGVLIGHVRENDGPGAVIGLAGAIAGGLLANQLWGNPVLLSWDLVNDGRELLRVFFTTTVDVTGAAIGAAASSIGLHLAAPAGQTPEAA
jgi:hypothetical protein